MENICGPAPPPTCSVDFSLLEQKSYERPNTAPGLASNAHTPQEGAVLSGVYTDHGTAILTFSMGTRNLVEGM